MAWICFKSPNITVFCTKILLITSSELHRYLKILYYIYVTNMYLIYYLFMRSLLLYLPKSKQALEYIKNISIFAI